MTCPGYRPDWAAMGDCAHCGRLQEDHAADARAPVPPAPYTSGMKKLYDRTVLVRNDEAVRGVLREAGYRRLRTEPDYLEVSPHGLRPSDGASFYPYVEERHLRHALESGTQVAPVRFRSWGVSLGAGGTAVIGCTRYNLDDALAALAASDATVRLARPHHRDRRRRPAAGGLGAVPHLPQAGGPQDREGPPGEEQNQGALKKMGAKKLRRLFDRTVLVCDRPAVRDALQRSGYALPAAQHEYLDVRPDGAVVPSAMEVMHPYVEPTRVTQAAAAGRTLAMPPRLWGWEVARTPGRVRVGCTEFRLDDCLAVLRAADAQVRRSRGRRREATMAVRALGGAEDRRVTVTADGSLRMEGVDRFHTCPRGEVLRATARLRAKKQKRG